MESPSPSGPGSGSAIDGAGIFLVLVTVAVFFIPIFILFPPVPPSRSEALSQTHAKIGLDRSKSNLKKKNLSSRTSQQQPTIQSLWIYPVKSCAGIELARSKVLPQGLEFDRLFTFAQLKSPFPVSSDESRKEDKKGEHTWHFITQRQFPLLATVKVELYVPDASRKPSAGEEVSTESFIILRFPWRERGLAGVLATLAAKLRGGLRARAEKEVLLPVAFPGEEEIRERWYDWEQVTIWKDTVEALNMAEELPEELRLYLGVSNKLGLFRVDPSRLREVTRCAPRREEAGYQPATGFQDAYPLHLINVRSVKDLEGKIGEVEGLEGLDVRRFRANIIVDGAEPYDEDEWKAVRFRSSAKSAESEQGAQFHVSCRTVRCKMPNVDQDNGFRHPVEPDKSLRKHREVDEGAPHMGCFGMQMTPLFENTDDPEAMESWVEVGMDVEVLERGGHRYIKQ
ncbi:putative molybdenum ion binding protein [Coniochaeta ligniaria NRRL 30616]|uniref:Putative molybdenum ion binding protein n=1 Tax=Coniochaeta ligniaria NRRL 30616 TaxID=1408157 RepID=A0A1J7IY27_9PEZI|nr:putative molybdenum ion binding protein [Coniochaeta ligniaria NRRL 30616]